MTWADGGLCEECCDGRYSANDVVINVRSIANLFVTQIAVDVPEPVLF